ncbi:MAG: DUF4982 domain-containing protein [Pontiellaceae bacterium]|jgi:beta-galactosidase|nr:DUF4982 domain-containing protein [Pontiellaceae bacterium]
MNKKLLSAYLFILSFPFASGCAEPSGREKSSFNQEWLMLKGDYSPDTIAEAGDELWEPVRLPHDWAIRHAPQKGKFMKNYGHYPLPGTYWYRKSFGLTAADQGKRIFLDFEGAMQDATVYLNGTVVGRWPNGYNSFQADLTPALKFGEGQLNELLVHLDLPKKFTRWYTGAGIYRNVWMVKTDPVHFAYNGIYVTTPEVSDETARVNVAMEIVSEGSYTGTGAVDITIIDQNNNAVAQVEFPASLTSGKTTAVSRQLTVPNPERWDITNPCLYNVVVKIRVEGQPKDELSVPLGIRTLKFDADNGFFLNGRHVKIYGVCNHHDLGPLGSAFNLRAAERQLEILRGMGCNAIRTSHNPPAPGLLDLCDRMGFLVMDELFDMWKIPKGEHNEGYTPKYWDDWWRRDVEAFVKRDRNHPCIIMWSSGNEIEEQRKKDGAELCRLLTEEFHKYDPTRPVTAGFNSNIEAIENGLADAVDVAGWNYGTKHGDWYNDFHKRPGYENKPQIATETVSCHSSRGYYRFPYGDPYQNGPEFQACSYVMRVPGYGQAGDLELMYQAASPSVAGEFVWTGFDYIGEPWPYPDDSTLSYYGLIDLCGFPKDIFYNYQSAWRPDHAMVHIVPHWTWPGREGQQTPIHVFTTGDEAELFVNGKSYGRRRKGEVNTLVKRVSRSDKGTIAKFPNRMIWEEVNYEPGEVKVIAWKDGKEIAQETVQTAGPAAGLRLTADRNPIRADYDDLCFITVDAVDAEGRFVPTFNERLEFSVEGAGELVALGSGNPADFTPMQGGSVYTAFNGKCLAIVRGLDDTPGSITVNVKGVPGKTTAIDDSDPSIEYSNEWKIWNGTSFGGTEHYATEKGARAKYTFIGTRGEVYGFTRAKAGIISVSVDGVFVKEADCYTEKENLNALLFDSGDLPQGTHVIEITITGNKNEASGSAQITLDKFRAYDPSAPVTFSGAAINITTRTSDPSR